MLDQFLKILLNNWARGHLKAKRVRWLYENTRALDLLGIPEEDLLSRPQTSELNRVPWLSTPTPDLSTLGKVWTSHQITKRSLIPWRNKGIMEIRRYRRPYLKVLARSYVTYQQMTVEACSKDFHLLCYYICYCEHDHNTCAREPVLSSAKQDMHSCMHSVAIKLSANLH